MEGYTTCNGLGCEDLGVFFFGVLLEDEDFEVDFGVFIVVRERENEGLREG